MKQIRVYDQVFRIEKTVYSIQGIRLPIPLSYRQLAFFTGTLFVMLLLNRFPPLSWIDFYLIKFLVIPAFVAWFFTRKKLDGKAPHRFMIRYLEHKFKPHIFARYQELKEPHQGYYCYEGVATYRISDGGDSK